MSRKHTDEELLEELKRVVKLLGRSPKQHELQKIGKYSPNSYKRAFGGISKALIIIGEKPTFLKNQTKEDCLNDLKRIYKKLGRIPSTSEFSELSNMIFVTLRKRINYQSWHSLFSDIGVSDEEIAKLKKHNVTNKELREEIIRLKQFLGRYPTRIEMINEGKYSCHTYSTRFGSWSKSFKALGFDDYINQSIYKNQIHSKGKDGIIYKSLFESRIANILFDYKKNNKIKEYEYERKVCKNKTWTCDFVITKNNNLELWIECDGMEERRKIPYNKGNKKINYYKENNIKYYIISYNIKPDLSFIIL